MGRQQRRAPRDVTPAYEDAGLFQGKMNRVEVRLVPKMARNERGDLIVSGFLSNNTHVNVVFPGRRRRESGPLVSRLQRLLKQAGSSPGFDMRDIDELGFNVQVHGAFRSQFHRDQSGWETRSYQLIAARWSMTNEIGLTQHFGEDPIRGAG